MATEAMERRPDTGSAETLDLAIEGMTCASCVRRVERALGKVEGVTAATVDLGTEKAHVTAAGTPPSALVAAVARAGYAATPLVSDDSGRQDAELEARRESRLVQEKRHALIALALAAPLVLPMLLMPLGITATLPPWLQFLLAAPVQFWLGARFYRAAWGALRAGTGNMDLLVALGTSAAFGLSLWNWLVLGHGGHALYFEAAALVTALVLLGKWLEGRAKWRTGEALRALASIRPTTARVRVDGNEVELPVASIAPGDVVVVRPGERIAVDGVIVEGTSHVDEAMVTGESLPVARGVAQPVIGGTINGEGLLAVRTTATGAETVLARIIRMVESAQAQKAGVQRLVDRVAAWFVPAVILIALVTAAAWWLTGHGLDTALINAVTVLVIACPCALGLATPMAIIAGTGAAARAGILIRDPQVLEEAHAIRTVAFDKTGTLTEGRPELTALIPADGLDEPTVLAWAAALQQGSEHPLARAVTEAATARELAPGRVADVRALPGRGLVGTVDGRQLAILSGRAAQADGIVDTALAARADEEAAAGRTVSWLVDPAAKRALAVLSFGDQPRASTRDAIARLRARGIRTVMLTGDNAPAGAAIGHQLGLDEVRAELLPEDKVAAIADLRAAGGHVAMVGDGVNDAPALAAADLGIAMGSGTDVAMASAGITLMRPDPRLVAAALDLAARTRRTIWQGLFWAFIYNVLGIPLAALGLLTPVVAGAAMALSSVSVVANAWRLQRWHAPSELYEGTTPVLTPPVSQMR